MSKVCRYHLPCYCRRDTSEFTDKVKNHIEGCIQKYMSLEETMAHLQDTHQIDPYITKTIWEYLKRENFFKAYYLRCETLSQIRTFNSLLEQQASLMIEHGLFDLTNPPPAIMDFLRQYPELQTRLLQNLDNTPSNQLQIRNDQQPQHHNQLSMPNGFAYNNVGGPSIGASDFGVPSFAQAATTAQDPSTSQSRNHIRNTVEEMQYLPQFQSLEYGEYSNGQQIGRNIYEYGESSNGLQSGRNTYEYGECSNGLQNREITYGLHYEVSINGIQNAESNNMLQYEGSINGLHGVILQEQHHFQEQVPVTIQTPGSINALQNGGSTNGMQGEPLYRIPQSEASHNPVSCDDTNNVIKSA